MASIKRIISMYLLSVFTATLFHFESKATECFFKTPFQSIIIITIDERGQASIGKDSFDTEGLTAELQKRFWGSYLGTGKMQEAVKVENAGVVPVGFQKSIFDAVKKAQQTALTDLCLQLHKKKFEDLTPKQKSKIKTKFPILFQQKF